MTDNTYQVLELLNKIYNKQVSKYILFTYTNADCKRLVAHKHEILKQEIMHHKCSEEEKTKIFGQLLLILIQSNEGTSSTVTAEE